jgi:hypothetical protein
VAVYVDVCLSPREQRLPTQAFTLLAERQKQLAQKKPHAAHGRRTQTTISPIFPTCIASYSADYLNDPAVQRAIHVKPSTVPGGKWADCGNVAYDFNYASELPNYRSWVGAGELQVHVRAGHHARTATACPSHREQHAHLTQNSMPISQRTACPSHTEQHARLTQNSMPVSRLPAMPSLGPR